MSRDPTPSPTLSAYLGTQADSGQAEMEFSEIREGSCCLRANASSIITTALGRFS